MALRKQDDGRSMVEMLGVLAVVSVLTIGGIAGFNRASHNMRTNQLKDEISTMVANTRSAYFQRNDYQDLNVTSMIGTGLVPDSMVSQDQKSIINRFQGSVLISSAQTGPDKYGSFILIFNGIDATTCRDLVMSDWGSDVSSGFLGITLKKDGDLSIETSKLTPSQITTEGSTYNAKDFKDVTLEQAYQLCDCGMANECALGWKFL